ncbi:MAG: GGDEF domain-containing protein [Erysipelotrichales bacterium]|nr:GGDEF domain-containing protein [Erysipelotrichales bacterium]
MIFKLLIIGGIIILTVTSFSYLKIIKKLQRNFVDVRSSFKVASRSFLALLIMFIIGYISMLLSIDMLINEAKSITSLILFFGSIFTFISVKLLDYVIVELQRVKMNRYDSLTQLLMKDAFQHTVNSKYDSFKDVSCVFIDVDNFKSINDTYGHMYGDIALKYVGKVLRDTLPVDAFVSRFGGDEFVAIIEETDKLILEEMFCSVKQQIQDICLEEHRGLVSVSIGICVSRKALSYDELLKETDECMYNVKKNGKNSYYLKVIEE